MCNATCLFIVRGDNIEVYMVFYVSCCTMIRLLKELAPFYGMTIQIKENLRLSEDFGIFVFDKSQSFQSLKYQKKQESSTSTICTSHYFLQVVIPPDLNASRFPYSKPVLLYHHQAINSVYGIPKYESILN